MELIFIDNLSNELNIKRDIVATIGEFDGVHIAHQKLIRETIKLANENNMASALITFFPHPDYVLKKREFEGYLSPLSEKKEIVRQYGIDYLIVINFDINIASLSKEDFYNKFLNKLKGLVVGDDYKFGFKGEGDVLYLKSKFNNNLLKIIDVIENSNMKVGSNVIRRSLKEGNIELANKLLNRNFSYSGVIEEGKKLGRSWGLPTANIKIDKDYFKIKKGVYVCKCNIDDNYYLGIANFGNNPTCNFVDQARLEVNLIDFNQDIYGKHIKVEFLKFVRDEKKFTSIEELIDQIKLDKEKAIKEFGGMI